MCILLSYVAKRISPGEFKLILVSNRDEYHHRPSKPANFIGENVLYGTDQTPGKEGGTWLGLNRFGKIGALLNLDRIDYADDNQNKEGRGFMVPNFLHSDKSMKKYLEQIKEQASNYNPFNLLLYERNQKDLWDVGLFNNYQNKLIQPESEFICISNHIYEKPYPKTTTGEKLLQNVVNEYNKTHQKQELMEKLFELARYDAGRKFEDEVKKGENEVREMMRHQCFINIPGYSTRTHTIILIDDKNIVTFKERTLNFPIDVSNKIWLNNKFEFNLKS